MRFYRLVHQKELDMMINEDKKFLGVGINQISTQSNSHIYDPRKKYLHFFYNKIACQHILQLYDNKIKLNKDGSVEDFYIISFDIPLNKVFKHTGKGYYHPFEGKIHGYDDYVVSRIELALNTEDFEKEWITQIEPAYYFNKKPKKSEEGEEPNN